MQGITLRQQIRRFFWRQTRQYQVLAIETSCDDTCASVLNYQKGTKTANVLSHVRASLNSTDFGGIIPTKAHEHHQRHIAKVVTEALSANGIERRSIKFVCVTKGPGMLGSLSTGLSFAKGLCLAWNIPLLGVHHMLGHLLIPRIKSSTPSFPFLSLLVSGGHTMLVKSTTLDTHEILCDTIDIAAGDALDKCGRRLGFRGTMIAREMYKFIQRSPACIDHKTKLPKLPTPLNQGPNRQLTRFSFAPFYTMVDRGLDTLPQPLTEAQRRSISLQVQDSVFEHIVTKIQTTLTKLRGLDNAEHDMVVSGGVGSNKILRDKLENCLPETRFHYPDAELCTDNAVMIGWAGIELYEEFGDQIFDDLSIEPVRKWPLSDILINPTSVM